MTELVLYTNPQSRGRIAHWMIEELGVPYRTEWIQYGAEMKSPAYLAVNPMGKVPAIRHGNAVVTEAAAICAYLADAFPQAKLAPPAGPERASYYRWLFFAAGPLEQATTARALGWQLPADKGTMAGFGSFDATIDAVAGALATGPYICGEQFTAADVYVGSAIGWGMLFGTIPKRPVFEQYFGRLAGRPAAKRANEINEQYMASRKSS